MLHMQQMAMGRSAAKADVMHPEIGAGGRSVKGRGASPCVIAPGRRRLDDAAARGEATDVLPRPRLLIVDDSTVVRRVLVLTVQQIPEFFYAEIDQAANGALALQLMARNSYDLVLSDVRMPLMDGLEFVRNVRAAGDRVTPIALITTLGTEEDVQRGREAGADAYILKPIVPAVIKTALREFLDHLTQRGRWPPLHLRGTRAVQ